MVCDVEWCDLEDENDQVLILILLEYGLRHWHQRQERAYSRVLILILLEYGLRPSKSRSIALGSSRLNPYSIGIWSATAKKMSEKGATKRS